MSNPFEFKAEPFEFGSTAGEMFESLAPESADKEWSEEAWRLRSARPIRSQRPLPRGLRPPQRPQKPIGRLPRRRWPIGYGSVIAIAPDSGSQSSEYTRWVQSTLDQVLGLPLADRRRTGDRDTQRHWQTFSSNKACPDGIVGPATEAALTAASQTQPPQVQDTTSEFETFEFETDASEWESEVNRSSRDYIKWVQRSLNQIMGLRLAVDGILGSYTRSAIRSFQQRRGLLVDGIVGPQTEAAIKAALRGAAPSQPQPTQPTPAPGGAYGPGSILRQTAVQLALGEWARWNFGDTKETDAALRPVLEAFWRAHPAAFPPVPAGSKTSPGAQRLFRGSCSTPEQATTSSIPARIPTTSARRRGIGSPIMATPSMPTASTNLRPAPAIWCAWSARTATASGAVLTTTTWIRAFAPHTATSSSRCSPAACSRSAATSETRSGKAPLPSTAPGT